MTAPKKVVLAYSGGLDTSIILKWLETEYGCEASSPAGSPPSKRFSLARQASAGEGLRE